MLKAGVVASSLVLLRLPVLLFGASTFSTLLSLAPFIAVIIVDFDRPTSGKLKLSPVRSLIIGAYLIVSAVAMFRDSLPANLVLDLAALTVLVIFAFVVFVREDRSEQIRLSMLGLAAAPGVSAFCNLLLKYGLGAPPISQSTIAVGDSAEILGIVGLSSERVLFPLAYGVNTYGIVCGVGMATAAVVAVSSVGRQRSLFAFLSGNCFVTLLLTDSRDALIAVVLALALYFGFRLRRRALAWVTLLIPFSVFAATALISGLELIFGVIESSGSATRTSSTASGRTVVWAPAREVVFNFSPETLVGWGRNGQLPSGVYDVQRSFFGRGGSVVVQGSHNMMLQTVIDTGYIGLVLATAVSFVAVRYLISLSEEPGWELAGGFAIGLVALVVIGFYEAAPTYLSPETWVWFIFVGVASMRLNPNSLSNSEKAVNLESRPNPRPAAHATWSAGRQLQDRHLRTFDPRSLRP